MTFNTLIKAQGTQTHNSLRKWMGIYRKIDKTVILHINSHLSVHTSVIKSCVCTRAITFGLCCFGTVFRLHRYTNLVYVHFNLFIDPTINSYTNPCNLASSRLL